MSHMQTSLETVPQMTQHAMLVIWGIFAHHIGLVKAIEAIKLKQKTRNHTPQTKVLEFLVALLGGLPHLQDISRSANPLDQDHIVAEAWGRAVWADYSGVSRSLSQLTAEEVADLVAALDSIGQPFIDQEVALALAQAGEVVYDADLTGRPVSSTSSSYPNTAFGHMGDTIELGYQAALVSMHSPTYGRLWLANELHPGDTVSMSRTQALVMAAEKRTGRRPLRRTELLASRLAEAQTRWEAIADKVEESYQQHREAQGKLHDVHLALREWEQEVQSLTRIYEQENRPQTAHCQLTRAQRKVATYTKRVPGCEKAVAIAQRRLTRHEACYDVAQAEVDQLQARYQQFQADNAANPNPIRATFRLDGQQFSI